MTGASWAPSRLLRARLAVLGEFLVLGVGLATWVTYIPHVQRTLSLSEGVVGGVLLALALGSLTAVLTAGMLIQRFGSRAVTIASSVFYCAALAPPIFAPSIEVLVALLFVFGLGLGMMDVAMNAQAASVEAARGRPLMSGFHGMYSLGNLAGAGVSAIFFALATGIAPHLAAVVGTMLAVCAVSAFWLVPVPPDPDRAGPQLGLPRGPLVGLAVFAFLIYVGEGALVDWTTVYLANDLGLRASVSVAGFAAFAGLMAAGRFVGDRVIAAWGAVPVALGSAALAAVGLAAALMTASLPLAVAGFGLSGLGFANLVPVLLSTAAKSTPDSPEDGIAGVAGVGYFGLVAGPPLVGFLAEALGLRGALFVVAAAMGVVVVALKPALRRATPKH